MPKIIRQVHSLHRPPLIAGGLIRDKEDTVSALSAGAVSISPSCGAKTIQEGRDVRR